MSCPSTGVEILQAGSSSVPLLLEACTIGVIARQDGPHVAIHTVHQFVHSLATIGIDAGQSLVEVPSHCSESRLSR